VIRLAFKNNTVTAKPGEFKLKGDQTELQLSGDVSLADSLIDAHASGRANLAVLQAFFSDVRSSGAATIDAAITGDISSPAFSGQATITNGLLRHYSMPQSLDNLNGVIRFDKDGILFDGLHGTLGGGDITFDGRVGFTGLSPSEFDLTAHGENMHLRYPKDFISTVNADLELRGPIAAPLLTGLVTVNRTTYTRQFEFGAGLYGLLVPESDTGPAPSAGAGAAEPSAFPLRFDVRVVTAAPMSFIDDKDFRLFGRVDLRFTGTLARVAALGNVDLDSGAVVLLGNRYQVTHGSISFTDPTGIQPFFDVEAETHVRVPGQDFPGSRVSAQDYRVSLRITGPKDHLVPTCTSDPPLPQVDCGSLLLGAPVDLSRAELRALGSQQDSELKFMQSMMGQLVAGAIYQKVGIGTVLEHSGVDTVQITPYFTNDAAFQNLNATARITIGKRISPNVYLTYSRALNASQDEVILLEYDQNDRISWIISRNEDRSFAIDFRVRYRF
jgi:autotransporter translocation and assembly factor TamB